MQGPCRKKKTGVRCLKKWPEDFGGSIRRDMLRLVLFRIIINVGKPTLYGPYIKVISGNFIHWFDGSIPFFHFNKQSSFKTKKYGTQ